MKTQLIAPCGMNCSLCMAYLREKNKCPGCRTYKTDKPDSRTNCVIKNCEIRLRNKLKYCSPKCVEYPCRRLRNLDRRYSTKYEMSMLENLDYIHNKGIRKFIANEKKRWINKGMIYCVHKKKYFDYK